MKNVLKKSLLLVFALLLAVALVACEGKKQRPAPEDEEETDTVTESEISFAVVYQGTKVELGKSAISVLEALGEANSVEDAASCGDGSTRKLYRYSSLLIYTLTVDGEETIDEIEVRDDSPETAAKIAIGSSESDVRKAYGTPTTEKDGTLIYVSGQMELTIDLTDGNVSGINLFRNTNG